MSIKEKERLNSDLIFKLIRYSRNRINHYFKSKNYKKNNKSFNFIGCSPEELKEHLESQFIDGMTWNNRSEWHIDHIIPLSSAKTEEELHKLFHYTNLQPLWAKDNLIKGKKTI